MKVLVNLIGLLLTLGSGITVLRSFSYWRGIAREGIFYFVLGFAFFSSGFIWKIFIISTNSSNMDLIFFSFGAAFMLLGAKKIFSLSGAKA